MTKAEERALEAYPVDICGYTVECMVGAKPRPQDWNEIRRTLFQEGYEQAEKDLVLTIQDLELLHTFLYAVKNNKHGAFTFTRLTDEQYAEVLKRYKEAKK